MGAFDSYRHKSYDGGLNNTASRRDIERNQASELYNWDITYEGRLKSRKGLTQVGGDLTAIESMGYYKSSTGSSLLVTDGTDIKYLNGSSFTDIGNIVAEPLSFANVITEEKIYFCSENNVLSSWDGGAAIAAVAGTNPHGNKMLWYQNHMFILNNVTVDASVYKNRMYISNFGDPEAYTTTTDYVILGGEGEAITADVLGNSMVIFKENSYMFLSGYGLASWVLSGTVSPIQNTDSSVGCPAVRGTVRVSANELWFIDNQGFIRRITQADYGYGSEVMSDNLEDSRDDLDLSKLSNAVAWYDDNKVYFALTKTGSSVNNVVWVFDRIASKRNGNREAWTIYTGWTVKDMISYGSGFNPTLHIASATNVYSHTGGSDDGVAIDCRWDGKNDDYDKSERFKKYAYGYIYSESQGSGSIDVYAATGGRSFYKLDTFLLTSTGTALGPTGPATMGPTGEFLLGGNQDIENKYYFADGGGEITAKTTVMSLRTSTTSQVFIDTFTNHFKLRSLR